MLPPSSGWRQQGPPKRWYPTTTLHGVNNPEDLDLNLYRSENFKWLLFKQPFPELIPYRNVLDSITRSNTTPLISAVSGATMFPNTETRPTSLYDGFHRTTERHVYTRTPYKWQPSLTHLDLLVVGSFMTITSVISPYLLKYSRRLSETQKGNPTKEQYAAHSTG
jgi:hypothetical protein